jgi:two-component system OmpR family sensor kinase
MKKNSILFTITITLFVSFVLVSLSFFVLYESSMKKEKFLLHKRAMDISRFFLHEYRTQGLTPSLIEETQAMNFKIIQEPSEIKKILAITPLKVKDVKRHKYMLLQHLEGIHKHYIYIQTPLHAMILEDMSELQMNKGAVLWLYPFIGLIFVLLYFSIYTKLKPLKVLQEKVKHLGDENFNLELSSNKKDEISQLANEFDASAKKLQKLRESRNVFLRNIMHELKTPITKGKFLLQLDYTQENEEKMQKVFYRLEALINEFASIEELMSSKEGLHKKEYFIEDIVDNAMDILMCEEDEVIKECGNAKIEVDFSLFSIAVKNLLDNALKYSPDKQVRVYVQADTLVFENSGSALMHNLQEYFEPFFKGDNAHPHQSFGLGLYIVKHIVDAHKFDFSYEHKAGKNYFAIKFTKEA